MDKVWVPDSARTHEKVVVQEQGFEKDLVRQKDLIGFVNPGFGDPGCRYPMHTHTRKEDHRPGYRVPGYLKVLGTGVHLYLGNFFFIFHF